MESVNGVFILFLGYMLGLIIGVLYAIIYLINKKEDEEKQLEEIRRKRKENQNI